MLKNVKVNFPDLFIKVNMADKDTIRESIYEKLQELMDLEDLEYNVEDEDYDE